MNALEMQVGDAAEVADMTEYGSTCPTCGTHGCKTIAAYRQATRQEPCTFLGFTGYCKPCGSPLLGMQSFQALDVQPGLS